MTRINLAALRAAANDMRIVLNFTPDGIATSVMFTTEKIKLMRQPDLAEIVAPPIDKARRPRAV